MPRKRRPTPTATPTSTVSAPPCPPLRGASARCLEGRLLVARCLILELLAECSGYTGPELAGLAEARRDLGRVLAMDRSGIVA